jgi:F-box/WD-40 domain protein 7
VATDQWRRGPRDPAGRLADLSDRPLLAMAVNAAAMEAACAGSDHAVYCVDVRRGERTKTLHGGRAGHSEWVTSVCYLGDGSGRVVSAGMDGKVCAWAARPAGRNFTCTDLVGHFGSVSAVASPGGGSAACGPPSARFGGLVVSAGYDKSVRLWDAASGRALAEKKAPHAAPVLCLSLLAKDGAGELLAASGDRDGVACVWRLHEGAVAATLRGHKGHLTACAWLPADEGDGGGAGGAVSAGASAGGADLVVTGAQDGHVRVWDLRSSTCVANVAAHASDQGSGAVGDITVASISPLSGGGGGGGGGSGSGGGVSAAAAAAARSGPGSESVIVTSGADRRICVLDPRGGFRVRSVFSEHRDFIYCLHAAGSLCFSGGGDGTLLAHDLSAGCPLWAVGAGMAAVRCIGVAADAHLVACGDDGDCMTYQF